MKAQEKRVVMGSVITLLLLVIVTFSSNKVYAQNKIAKENYQNWMRMIDKLHLKLPKDLPPPAKDPSRPAGTFQKKGSHNWYDTAGNTYVRSAWGTWNNYDEAKANPYPKLPDPLKLGNGQKITKVSTWWNIKRPEIQKEFSEEIYGFVPKNVPGVTWKVVATRDTTIGKIDALVKQVMGRVDNSSVSSIKVNIKLTVVTPLHASGPVPVIMQLQYMFPKGFKMPPMSEKFKKYLNPRHPDAPSWKEQLLREGWGYALYYPQTVQADNGAGLTRGIIGLVNKGMPRQPDQWGALRAWAWGAGRCLDFLETDKQVNSKEVGIEGLSRFGKEALVIMAYDQRFAIGFIGSSGKGGAALYRRHFGETIGILCSTGEYHWFAGNFLKYARKLNASDLKVDAHELFAMCAPRPVFLSVGNPKVEGRWMDDRGQFMAEVAAGPVYTLLGKKGLESTKMPAIGTALLKGDLAFRQHFGPHTVVPNWPYFIKFALHYFKPVPIKK